MKKYFLSFAIFIVLLLASTIFLPYLFKDRIIEEIKKQATESLKVNVDFNSNISINIFKSFPNLSLGIKDISLTYDNKFLNDTLLHVDKMELSIDLMEFYQHQNYRLRSILMEAPQLHLELLNDSTFNWDLMESTEENGESIDLELEKIQIVNGSFSYHDVAANLKSSFDQIAHLSSGSYNTDSFLLNASTTVDQIYVDYGGIKYINNWSLVQDGQIYLDLLEDIYSFRSNDLKLNGIDTKLDGFIQLVEENILFNLKSQSTSPDLNQFLTLIPAIYKSDFEHLKTEGSGSLAVEYKGLYSATTYPSYDVDLAINKGWFKYPDMDLPAEDIDLHARFYSEDGNPDNTVIDISKFNFSLDESPFTLQLLAKNLNINPYIDLKSAGNLNLETLNKIIPFKETVLGGDIQSDVSVKGSVGNAALANLNTLKAKGVFKTNNLIYKSVDMPETLEVKEADLEIDNNLVNIKTLDAKLGKNDIKIDGRLNNFLAYAMNSGTLYGRLGLSSNSLNVNDFLTESSSEDSVQMTLIEVPGDLSVDLTTDIKNLVYDDLHFTNFKGSASVNNRTLTFDRITTDLLGGNLNFNGKYLYDEVKPHADFEIAFTHIKVADLANKFKIIQAFAPLANEVNAQSTAKLTFSSLLKSDMSPDLTDVSLGGLINLESIKINSLDVLKSLDSKLGTNHFNVDYLNDMLLKFNINDGNLWVEPFSLFIDSSILNLSGLSKLNGNINYAGILSIPSAYVSNEVSTINALVKNTKFDQLEVKPNQYLDIAVKIAGTVKEPNVELNLQAIKDNVKQSIASSVSEEVENKKKEAEELVKTELDKIKDETAKKAEETENRLKEEAEKKKKEAEEKLKAEAEAAKKKLEDEAKKKLRNLIK